MPSRMRAPLLAVVAVVVGLAAAPAAQAATAFEEVLKDYKGDANINPCKHSDKTLSEATGQVPNDIEQYAPDFPEALGNAISARAQGACEGKDAGGADEGSGGGGSSGSGGSSGGGGSGSGGSSGSGSGSSGGSAAPAPSGGSGAATPPGGSPGAAPPPLPTPAPPPSGVSNAPSANQVPVPTRPASSQSIPPVPIALLVILAGLVVLGGLFFTTTRWLGLDGDRIAGARHTWGEAGYRAGATWADFRDWLRVGR